MQALGVRFPWEGVVGDHLGKTGAGEHDDGGLHGEAAGDLLLQGVCEAGDAGVRAGEHKIAAAEVGGDPGVPE